MKITLEKINERSDPYQIFWDSIDAAKIVSILAAESHPMAYVTNLRLITVQI